MPDPVTLQTATAVPAQDQSSVRDEKSIPNLKIDSVTTDVQSTESSNDGSLEATTRIMRKRGNRDTVSILLDELRKAKPTIESFVTVDRTLPPPPTPAVVVETSKSTASLFSQNEHSSEEIDSARKQFVAALCRFAKHEQLRNITELMAEFETRIFKSGNLLAEAEIYDSYKQLNKLLSAEPKERSLPWQSRLLAVSHFFIHAAKPETICQGSKVGSQVMCFAQKLISSRPSRLAEILSSAGIDGEWQAFDGKILKIDEHSLKPGPEELLFRSGDHKRSYAAKIWQIFMLNNCLTRRTVPMIYSETPGRPGKDYGGQILRTIDGQVVNPKLGANVSFFELALLSKFEFGESNCIFVNDLSFAAQSAELRDLESQNMLVHFKSASELSDLLAQARDEGRLPVTVAVDERRLLAESYQDGINHSVNVLEFNEYGSLRIFNPLLLPGMQRSARVSLQRLYNATLSNFRV